MPPMPNGRFSIDGKRIFIAGHRGMLGRALMRRLAGEGCTLITAGRDVLDLRRQADVEAFFDRESPDAVLIAAARVGGILANRASPFDFIYDNLTIGTNIVRAAHETGVRKLVYVSSSAIYPSEAPSPIQESSLLAGAPDHSHMSYSLAKVAVGRLVQSCREQFGDDFVTAVPTNLYGPHDHFDLQNSHVVPALIRKVHEAKRRDDPDVVVWGTGAPRRELLHCDDCADALIRILEAYSADEHINVGCGEDVSILDLTRLVCDVAGFQGGIRHDLDKPDGAMRRLMSADKLRALDWRPRIGLRDGLAETYQWFLENEAGLA